MLVVLIGCGQIIPETPKIKGVSFVASKSEAMQNNIDPIVNINANYAAIMPFGFIKSLEQPEIIYDTDRQWYGESVRGASQYIGKLHENGINVMLKPQLWLWHGEFTGNLRPNSEDKWILLEESYRNFILDFAAVAESSKVNLFCIGTELEQFVLNRPEFWSELIVDIRKVYKGNLTYAANWDEYKRVPFWDEMDYIGVDAYFPISESQTPSLEEVRRGWQPWKTELKEIARAHNKQIVFTEYGYRSVDYAGKEPWRSDREMSVVNLEAQVNLSQGLYDEVWKEAWFAGGFIWKWFLDHSEVGGHEDSQFTPQNKPVEAVIKNAHASQ